MRPLSIPPSMAWLTIFLPALSYYIATRLNVTRLLDRSSSLGIPTTDTLTFVDIHNNNDIQSCSQLSDVFHVHLNSIPVDSHSKECSSSSSTLKLRHPLYLILEDGLQDVVATLWRHDSELGRGFLLLSQAHKQGRIWRYEIGGGPIPIGRTLHMEPSGCRSNQWNDCQRTPRVGSAGLAIDFFSQSHPSEGKLVVAELGEGRIVRMEESGARTPLILQVPPLCSTSTTPTPTTIPSTGISIDTTTRLTDPSSLLYTPFGDLLVAENHNTCGGTVLRLRNAMQIEPLSSAVESRQAHSWNTTINHTQKVEILYQDGMERVGGIALDTSWTGLYVTAIRDQSLLLLHLPLTSNDDDGDDDEEEKDVTENQSPSSDQNTGGILDGRARLVYNITNANALVVEGGAIAVDKKGRVFMATLQGVTILDVNGSYIGTLPIPKTPTSLTLGDDGFLYVSTLNQLFRIKVKEGPLHIPTDLVIRPLKKKIV